MEEQNKVIEEPAVQADNSETQVKNEGKLLPLRKNLF